MGKVGQLGWSIEVGQLGWSIDDRVAKIQSQTISIIPWPCLAAFALATFSALLALALSLSARSIAAAAAALAAWISSSESVWRCSICWGGGVVE